MNKEKVKSKIVEILDDYAKNGGDSKMRVELAILMREYISGPYEFIISDGMTATVEVEIDDAGILKI